MGIGRFAFTPQLPLMLADGLLDADGGAWLAAINYLGYLIGALLAARVTASPRRLVLACLFATAVITGSAGFTQSLSGWLLLRAAAGVLSAWVLVGVSTWSMGELTRRGRADALGSIFSGVGAGIAAVGLLAWAWGSTGSASLWHALGVLAALLALLVQQLWPRSAHLPPAASQVNAANRLPLGSGRLILCYGSCGFGYIVAATYLPTLARAVLHDARLFGLAWPVFGLAAAASTVLAGLALRRRRPLRVWSACHLLMATGNVLPLFSHSGLAIAMAALLVGGTFMIATMTGLQQARLLAPSNPARLLGNMTAAFAVGQIAGPLIVLALTRTPLAGWSGIEATLMISAVLLCATALWLRQPSGTEAESSPR